MPTVITALAADLTSVAVPLVCTCVVAGVDVLPLGPLGIALALALDCYFWTTEVPLLVLH